MKKNYSIPLAKAFLVTAIFHINSVSSQVQFNLLPPSTGILIGINDSGQAITSTKTYDFATNTLTPLSGASAMYGINNDGDLIGALPIVISGQNKIQPAYKKNGVWYPMGLLPGSTVNHVFNLRDISENGNFITGSISYDCCHAEPFIYDVTAGTYQMTALPPNAAYLSNYGVNNAGTLTGFFNAVTGGTVPFYKVLGSAVTAVNMTPGSYANFSAINNSGLMVGGNWGQITYDMNTMSYTHFDLPYNTASGNLSSGTFSRVSDTGNAIGNYSSNVDSFIYNPSIANIPLSLKNLLIENGVPISIDLRYIRDISPNGNYICGSIGNQSWVLNLNNVVFNTSFIECPANINQGQSVTNIVKYTMPFAYGLHPNATLVLQSGLASGSDFPVGTTQIVHNLVDTDGTILDSCSFSVTIHSLSCNPTFDAVEAISRVSIGGSFWENLSDPNDTAPSEDFTSMPGHFLGGESPPIVQIGPFELEGNTAGNFTDYFTIYFDWDHSGIFEPSERFEMGTITNSTGADGIKATGYITVSQSDFSDNVRMRVIKTRDNYAMDACPTAGRGQIEDYRMSGGAILATDNFTTSSFKYYPNPATDVLNVSNNKTITSITIFNLLGQEIHQSNPNAISAQINIASLRAGTYFVKAASDEAAKTFKLLKH